MMFEYHSSYDTVVGFTDGNAFRSQFAINISRAKEYGFRHGQYDQWVKKAPNAPMRGVVADTLEDLGQVDAAQGKIFVVKDELLQCVHMWQITTREEIDPDAGVDQNH